MIFDVLRINKPMGCVAKFLSRFEQFFNRHKTEENVSKSVNIETLGNFLKIDLKQILAMGYFYNLLLK